MKRSKYAELVEHLLKNGPLKYPELFTSAKKHGLKYHMDLKRALDTLFSEKKIDEFLKDRNKFYYLLTPETKSKFFLKNLAEDKSVISGAYIRLILKKELSQLYKQSFPELKNWDWDMFNSFLRLKSKNLDEMSHLGKLVYYLDKIREEIYGFTRDAIQRQILDELPELQRRQWHSKNSLSPNDTEEHGFLNKKEVFDNINRQVFLKTEDLMNGLFFVSSYLPFQMHEFEKKIKEVFLREKLNNDDLNKIVAMLLRPDGIVRPINIHKVLDYINTWPALGPHYIHFEQEIFNTLIKGIEEREHDLTRKNKQFFKNCKKCFIK